MVRILHVFYSMSNGGVEGFVMNYYRHIDRSKIQFDFLTSVDEPGYYDEEIRKLGGRLFHAYPLKKNPFRNFTDIIRIVRDNNYTIVHRHTGNAFGYYELRAARLGGAKHLILHAHNPVAESPKIHKISKRLLSFNCVKFACSSEAGRFLFGDVEDVHIIKNAIECDAFLYNSETRKRYRDKLDLGDSLVIGHVGRFEKQKNHIKLFEIFREILCQRPDSILICIGEGTLFHEMKQYANNIGIINNVRFLGNREDVNNIINTFDLFCFPSLYEGFSVALIEAQANGLKCIASKDVIPVSANITGNVRFVSLTAPSKVWAEHLLSAGVERDNNASAVIKAAGYDISLSAKSLADFYCSFK